MPNYIMYGLVDITSAYCSAEKIYDPTIRNKPCIVLSNNDSTIVAVCPIAKRLGFKKFTPYFQVKQAAQQAGVVVRSSNYELYQDVSHRLNSTLQRYSDAVYEYSIDEAFLGYENALTDKNWYELGHEIRKTIWREVKVPVGVGFGLTPTLAKAANHAAKKLPDFHGSATINTPADKAFILKQMSLDDVWGIGHRLAARLSAMGIKDAFHLSKQDPTKIRKQFSILVEGTVRELNGEVRLSWDDIRPAKKEIYSTRSFGQRITCINELKQALVGHVEVVATKLRKQDSVAKAITLFATNSPHDQVPYVKKRVFATFPSPTSDTRNLIQCVSSAMGQLYQPGIQYYKAGVGLLDISDASFQQGDLFSPSNDNIALMSAIDSINQRYGRNTLQFAAKGKDHQFAMRRSFLSKRPTTRWSDIPKIKC